MEESVLYVFGIEGVRSSEVHDIRFVQKEINVVRTEKGFKRDGTCWYIPSYRVDSLRGDYGLDYNGGSFYFTSPDSPLKEEAKRLMYEYWLNELKRQISNLQKKVDDLKSAYSTEGGTDVI